VAHPEKLGKYRITSVLGEGAMGVVYRAFDPDIRRVVALKTIRKTAGEGIESAAMSAARFRNEAHAAGRLVHPGIVGVYDFGDDGRVAYIAMEFVQGHTLSAYLARKVSFSAADVASVICQVLDALGHAHEHGVWHRDIKPSNVIMTRSGRVKIADFGIARTEDSGLTAAGGILGTPMYMAPEQFLGGTIDHRVDLYGTGVLLYQLIAGQPPFVGHVDALSYRVVHEVPRPPSKLEGAAPFRAFDGVALQALAKNASARFESAAAFRMALAASLGHEVPPAVSEAVVNALPVAEEFEPTQRMPPPPSSGGHTGSTAGTAGTIGPWSAAELAQVQAALAKHVGPLAGTMVRRAARDCADLPTLHARLAEQITQDSVREAFLGQLRSAATGSSGTGGSGSRAAPPPTGGSTPRPQPAPPPTGGSRAGPPVSDTVLEQAQRLLAQHLGPIARVVVKRSAERTRERGPLFDLLLDAAPAAVRGQLRLELDKLH
jgi:eukaryotic-like serine/threonine-protein kinase